MATLEELVVKIEADNAKLLSSMAESQKATSKAAKEMQDAVTQFADKAGNATSRFDQIMNVFAGTTMANIATKAFSVVTDAAGMLVGQFLKGIDEAAAFEQQMTRVANSLALSGNFSQAAIKNLSAYADTMEGLTGVQDDVIASNLAMLSSMTKLDAEGLKKAQTAALDLSAAMGIDLATATKMVGKAANGETDSFKKLGISIDETGDKASTLQGTLRVLETSFGGAAAGAMKTYAGAVTNLGNSFGNLFQELGTVISGNPAIIAAFNQTAEVFRQLTGSLSSVTGGIGQSIAETFSTILKYVALTAAGVESFINKIVVGFKTILLGTQFLVDSFEALGHAMDGNFTKAADSFNETVKASDSLNESVNADFSDITKGLLSISAATTVATESMNGSLNSVTASVANQSKKVAELSVLEKMRLEQAKAFAAGLVEASVQITNSYQLQNDAIEAAYNGELGIFESYKEAKLAALEDQFKNEEAALLASRQVSLEGEALYQAAKTQLEATQSAARLKMQQDMQKKEEEVQKQKLAAFSGFFGNLATLQSSSSKELAAIGKAAALAQATIDGYAAVQGAYKSGAIIGGPALGAAFAVAAGIATAGNLAKIAGVGLKTGIDSVPGVGSGDNFPAMLAPGERVVPSETNQDLTEFLARERTQTVSPINISINFNGLVAGSPQEIGSQLIEYINESIARGTGVKLGAV